MDQHARNTDANPLQRLAAEGQRVWLDDIQRSMIESGELARLVDDGVAGITSNPAIFEHAIGKSSDYDEAIEVLRASQADIDTAYEQLVIEDVRRAADVFRPLYERSGGDAGFVSLEVSPHLARDTGRTVAEARRFWNALDRPNVFIKVPGTREGLGAIAELIADGINVNVTLLFGVERYAEVAEAYWQGLERRRDAGRPIDGVRSVASFFLSRIDSLLDPRLKAMQSERAGGLVGKAAVACAKAAYQRFTAMSASERWKKLEASGAAPQKLLWASTGTKDPAYSDVKYVEELIGPATVTTLPRKTLEAFRDHGRVAPTLEQDGGLAETMLADLGALGIDLRAVSNELEERGIVLFVEAYDRLRAVLEGRLGGTD